MAAYLTPDQIDDFVNLTLNKFHRLKWTDLALEYQHYCFAKMVNSKRIVEQGGPRIEFKIKTRNTGNARNTGMFETDKLAVEDVTIAASTPWRKQTGGFAYDVDEDLFQSDRETIVRILKLREHDALSDLAELNEINLWTAPASNQDNRPMGIPFWLQKNASANPEGAFTGGNPSGWSGGAAGVDSTAHPRWRNWAFGYRKVTQDDLVRKVKRALTFTHFRAPVPHPEVTFGEFNHEMFSTYRVQEPLERLAESRNENLGKDVARYMNQVTIGGVTLEWVPYLEENDLSDPLYGINWQVLRPYVKSGANMRRSKPKVAAHQHTVREVFIDTWMNFICTNRRLCFVGSLQS